MRRLLYLIIALIVLVVGGLLALPMLVSNDAVKDHLTAQFRSLTGRSLDVKGDIALSYWPSLRVSLHDVSLSNAAWATEPAMLTAKALGAELALLPLLRGEMQIIGIALESPVVALETSREGQVNWRLAAWRAPVQVAGPGTPPALESLKLERLTVTRGTLITLDHGTGKKQILTDLNASLSLPDIRNDLTATLSTRFRDRTLEASVRVGPLLDMFKAEPAKASLSLTAPELSLRYDGTLTVKNDEPVFNGELTARAGNLPDTLAWANGEPAAPPVTTLSLTGKLNGTPKRLTLADARIGADSLTLTGEIGAELDGAKPFVSARLNTETLDLTPFMPREGETVSLLIANAFAETPRWSADPLALEGLRAVNMESTLTAGNIIADQFKATGLNLQTTITGGTLQAVLKPLALYEGTAEGSLTLSASGMPEMRQELTLSKVQIGPLLRDMKGIKRISGTADMQWSLRGAGESQAAMVSSLAGGGKFSVTEGALHGIDFLRLFSNPTPQDGEEAGAETRFTSLTGTATVKSGIISNHDLKMESPKLRVAGQGNVILPEWLLDYKLTPVFAEPKPAEDGTPAPKKLNVSFKVDGPIDHPRFRPAFSSLAKEALKDPDAAKETLKSIKEGIGDIGGQLKGLFGN